MYFKRPGHHTEIKMNSRPKNDPIHPGEILFEEFMAPLDLSQNRLAIAIDVPRRRINEIVRGTRRVSANTALRLSRYFGTSEPFWINLQSRYDVERERNLLAGSLDQIVPYKSANRQTPSG